MPALQVVEIFGASHALEIWPNDPEPRGAERAAEIDRVNKVVLASAAAHELPRRSPRPKRM